MDVLASETCWALSKEIIKQVTSSWSLFTQQNFMLLNLIPAISDYITAINTDNRLI